MNFPRVQFEMHTPVDDGTIADHIAHACSLGLPEADAEPLHTLTIIANGPSARDAPLDGDTLALNGALKLFMNTGRLPTYWAACDPQALVADFLPDNPPKDVIYLVASKCHPSVFKKLKGRDVRLWHINDHPIPDIPTDDGDWEGAIEPRPYNRHKVHVASSVTLVVMPLMRRAFNYRAFNLYGWDACYEEVAPGVIKHHASALSMTEYPEGTLDLIVGATQTEDGFEGGRTFKTSRTWAAEAQDAIVQLQYADYQVTIHGDGLIKAIRESR